MYIYIYIYIYICIYIYIYIAAAGGAVGTRFFSFREFFASGDHRTRVALCPCAGMSLSSPSSLSPQTRGGLVCPVTGSRAPPAGDSGGSSSRASSGGGRGRRGGGSPVTGGARGRSPGRLVAEGGAESGVDGGGVGSMLRYYDGREWKVGH